MNPNIYLALALLCSVGGAACEEDINECEIGSGQCLGRGVCHNSVGSFRCDCLPGWTGLHCQISDGSGSSRCFAGYTGVNCTDDFDECSHLMENPCEQGSTCVNTPGNFTCNCRTGWEGHICDKDINECNLTTGLCHNGGICTNIPGSYRCSCPHPYWGPACDNILIKATSSQQMLSTLPDLNTLAPQVPNHNDTQSSNANWTIWTIWSNCDTTCGNGSSTRTRTLVSRPIGMPQCISREREILHCTNNPCPVNGDWTGWSRWGHCSVSCGIGLERRNRNCSNPYPGPGGRPCSGGSTKDRPCFIKSCSDGLWSDWNTWGTCSASCLGGIQKRTRICNNPAPSQFGHDCVGNSEDLKLCGNRPCQDAQSNPTIAFRASKLSSLSPTYGQTLIYTNTEINQGGGYDSNTGVFTTPKAGLFMFVVQTCADSDHDFSLSILKDGHVETSTELYFADGYTCYTTNALVSMMIGNRVWIASKTYSSGPVLYEDANHINMFQGTRIGT